MRRRDLAKRLWGIWMLCAASLCPRVTRAERRASIDDFHKAHDKFAEMHNDWARKAAAISPASPDYNARVIGKFLEHMPAVWRRMESLAVEIARDA